MFCYFGGKGALWGGGVSTTTRLSNVHYHAKWVLTKISPFENAKLGMWVNQRRAGGGRDVRDMREGRKKAGKAQKWKERRARKKTAKETVLNSCPKGYIGRC